MKMIDRLGFGDQRVVIGAERWAVIRSHDPATTTKQH